MGEENGNESGTIIIIHYLMKKYFFLENNINKMMKYTNKNVLREDLNKLTTKRQTQ